MKNKRLLKPLIVVVLALAVLVAARNIIIRISLEQYVRVTTGIRLDIGKLDTGLIDPTVTIRNLELYNPAGYADPVMADIEEIHFCYKRSDLLKGRIYLKELYFNLGKLFIIRKSINQLNFDTFQAHENDKPPQVTIDDLILKAGKIIYKDYTHSLTPEQKVYDLDLNEHYTGIQGANDMEHRIMESVLKKTSIASSIRGDLNRFKEDISGTILNGLQISDNSIKGLLNLVFFNI